jgi:hypothetical protein
VDRGKSPDLQQRAVANLTMDAPSIVPDLPSDLDVADLAAVVSLLQRLAHAEREGDVGALAEAEPLFASIPGLRAVVRSLAVGQNRQEAQGALGSDRRRVYEKRNVARARAYQKYRRDPVYCDTADSSLKAVCGGKLVEDPRFDKSRPVSDRNRKWLKTLSQSQAILSIDKGLALIATGRFLLSRTTERDARYTPSVE